MMNNRRRLEEKYLRFKSSGLAGERSNRLDDIRLSSDAQDWMSTERRKADFGNVYENDFKPPHHNNDYIERYHASQVPREYPELNQWARNGTTDRQKLLGSPIKHLNTENYTPSRLKPAEMYKLLSNGTPTGKGILVNGKNRRYNSKNLTKTPSKAPHAFQRLRQFLSKMYKSAFDDGTNIETLRESAINILGVGQSLNSDRHVSFANPQSRDCINNEQEVRQESNPRFASKYENFESETDENLRHMYEDRLDNLERAYYEDTHELKQQITDLKCQLATSDELSKRSKSHNATIDHEASQRRLESETLRLRELEQQLLETKRNLEKEYTQLLHERKDFEAQKMDIEEKRRQIIELDKRRSEILERSKSGNIFHASNNANAVRTLKAEKERVKKLQKTISQRSREISSDLRHTEDDYVAFFESISVLPSLIIQDKSRDRTVLLREFESILFSLNPRGPPQKSSFETVKRKFRHYESYLKLFADHLLNNDQSLSLQSDYRLEDLVSIDNLLAKLQRMFMKSLSKKELKLSTVSKIESRLNDVPRYDIMQYLNDIKIIASSFEKRSKYLSEIKGRYDILAYLLTLRKDFTNLMISVRTLMSPC
ncbi:Piso0_002904 [Millerozyma farinosa CBS 7064]|uniref:Piso0_002904 protein n=1 Tax=Pichia sorbitophila (strain ATCC MYA-4447 / BCRC 22081 / CBS 7064 / NBRC 10061 / NRRL Y-12695) TaxID=559304 RepID=G8YGM6_PICSO|nr:Piso0_002904 [Millerozyma farinosa CBS 7064]CCE80578.1 Piso0_002904 [Millerozyma farinosa CBS 7064]